MGAGETRGDVVEWARSFLRSGGVCTQFGEEVCPFVSNVSSVGANSFKAQCDRNGGILDYFYAFHYRVGRNMGGR